MFEDTHLLLLRVLSTASEVLSFLQNFHQAAEYSLRMVDGYRCVCQRKNIQHEVVMKAGQLENVCVCFSKLYHHNNAQLGMAIMRAGVTHWHAGLIEVAHGLICRAFAILMITHGPHHPITKDLEVNTIPYATRCC